MAPGTDGKDKRGSSKAGQVDSDKRGSTKTGQVEEDAARGPPQERGPLWVYGVNAHLSNLELPPGFAPTGNIRPDYVSLCRAVGAVPHPAFKPKPVVPLKRKESTHRKPSKAHFVDSEPEAPKEETSFCARSFLLDNPSMRLFSLLLPSSACLKVLVFSECSLDMEMLGWLRAGLAGSPSIEALQVEWNPFELPLPSLEEVEATSQKSAEADSEDALSPLQMSWRGGPPGGGGETDLLELRERRRYLLQSQRSLSSFKSWLATCCDGNLGDAWKSLDVDGDIGTLLTKLDFHDRIEARLGLSGQHVLEVFDILDGPDYAAGEGKLSLLALKEAMEFLPGLVLPEGQQDPIGGTLATFLEGDAHLESVSFRACSVAWPELQPMCNVLASKPWQLRCLNLWDNRICDYGAELLARALEEYRGLEYLGLGRNRITDSGLEVLCSPFNHVVVTETGLKAAQERVKQQQDHLTQLTKAKAKAKPDPSKKPAAAATSRHTREPVYFVSTLEEVKSELEGASPSWILKRGCELKSLNVAENPIRTTEVVEAVHTRGPTGAELVLRGTPAAERLLKAGGKVMEQRRPTAVAGGWLLRLT
mmetsp:Transcript_23441/g.43174  ORF Transcript_23441/g.43174 Transcript_23441/m.43174 type:complete len:591 (-) Transcript_23441:139-1911(-)